MSTQTEVLDEIRTKAEDAMNSGIDPDTYKKGFAKMHDLFNTQITMKRAAKGAVDNVKGFASDVKDAIKNNFS